MRLWQNWIVIFVLTGERELVEFLAEEILAERKAQKVKNLATELDGFKVKVDDAEVTLTKASDKETWVVYSIIL